MPNAKLARRRERADVICEALRALDATGMTSSFYYFMFSSSSCNSKYFDVTCILCIEFNVVRNFHQLSVFDLN